MTVGGEYFNFLQFCALPVGGGTVILRLNVGTTVREGVGVPSIHPTLVNLSLLLTFVVTNKQLASLYGKFISELDHWFNLLK